MTRTPKANKIGHRPNTMAIYHKKTNAFHNAQNDR